MPKVELHRHIEGGVRFETITDMAKHHKLDLEVRSEAELLQKTKVKEPMNNLEEVLDAFWTTQKTLCSYEAIKRITFENVEDAFHDGVKLLELRFAPVFIAHGKDLGFDEIFEGVLDGISAGMDKYDLQVGLIHIIPRPLEPEKHETSNREFLRYRHSLHKNAHRLCGFDLADSETVTDPKNFAPLVEAAREAGVGITVHTGENTDAAHARRAIETYSPQRIGHGIRIIDDPEVMEMVRERNIHLEICPTSNWLTRSVASIESHPLPDLHRAGVSVSINSDDPQLMDIDLVNEYEIAQTFYGMTVEEFYKINRAALAHSFLDRDIRKFTETAHFNT